MKKSHAYRLIESISIINTLSPIGDMTPITESQCRPLAKLEPEQQQEAWQQAVDTAPEGKITARHISIVGIGGTLKEHMLFTLLNQQRL
jgi:hypothetical protein